MSHPDGTGYTTDVLRHGGNELISHADTLDASAARTRDLAVEASAGAIKGLAGTAVAQKLTEVSEAQQSSAALARDKGQGVVDTAGWTTDNEHSRASTLQSITF